MATTSNRQLHSQRLLDSDSMTIASMTGFAREAGATRALPLGLGAQDRQRPRARRARCACRRASTRSPRRRARRLPRRLGGARAMSTSASDAAETHAQVRVNEAALQACSNRSRACRCLRSVRPPPSMACWPCAASSRSPTKKTTRPARSSSATCAPGSPRASPPRGGAAAARARRSPRCSRPARDYRRLTSAAESCPARQPRPSGEARRAGRRRSWRTGAPSIPQRLHQEAVLIATRADIREEIDRLVAHVAAARALLAEGGLGRPPARLPGSGILARGEHALRQGERHRLSAIGLDLKAVVEQFREQVQNVE